MRSILAPFALFLTHVLAQSGTYQTAVYVAGQTNAVQAQCPADHPQRCDAIQQPN